ncbi:YhjD/YihY/BrkB family envelope integrity protein [Corynebacterium falsenii]|uniref:YhjD/YihY/BrkB family envelope integrity protein n=1 Tax=Corynebacterium falsenii TaxID=108486 RepID=UPI0003E94A8A|nr:YhjD/YihY/BrkB family envelope integrity protein [Corynebacterium falsenii]AHI03769.1 ribonuclease [Corynebacterium falsenii DSM 44353]UBI04500.1 YihY/virulence factor BrkB family protein [Corynebacterium falsenii]HJF11195.1 YihY/virulence factor BrkB family protein [Corynebacterium falsenii]
MATTDPDKDKLDYYGVERSRKDEPGFIDKYREKFPWFDHIMRMQERYTEGGGNQFAAGITYFSVMTIFPLLMLTFAITAMVLAGNQELLDRTLKRASELGDGQMGDLVQTIIEQAIAQRASVFSIGLLLALWTGLSWVHHLRMGMSSMWKVPGTANNFVMGKLKDLVGLIGIIIALLLAFFITAVGSSGFTEDFLRTVGLGGLPGLRFLIFAVALVIALIANYLVFAWMLAYLPRTKTHRKSVFKAALIGAIAFEIFKQFATVFFSNALSNPAGAVFGPIIGLMVLMYFTWRIMLYCSAWAATTYESMAQQAPDAPPAAVIRVRQEVRTGASDAGKAGLLGTGAAIGVVVGGAITSLFKR